MVLPAKFSAAEFWRDFTTHGANWYTAVPTIHQILLKSPPPSLMPSIRFIRSCSSPLPPAVFHRLEETFQTPVLEAYAMTEAAHQMTSNPLAPGKRKPGSVGIGMGVDIKILDESGKELSQGKEGEICVKGENVTKGYLNNPEANKTSYTSNGFFRTGDQGKLDEDGYVIITGRIKELINKGGEKISPIELDNILTRHPAVSEAVSFAIEDEMYGQDIGVAVVTKDGEKVTEEDLKKWVAGKAAKFKIPKKVRISRNFCGVCLLTHFPGILQRYHAKDGDREDSEENCSRNDDKEREGKGTVVRALEVDISKTSTNSCISAPTP